MSECSEVQIGLNSNLLITAQCTWFFFSGSILPSNCPPVVFTLYILFPPSQFVPQMHVSFLSLSLSNRRDFLFLMEVERQRRKEREKKILIDFLANAFHGRDCVWLELDARNSICISHLVVDTQLLVPSPLSPRTSAGRKLESRARTANHIHALWCDILASYPWAKLLLDSFQIWV